DVRVAPPTVPGAVAQPDETDIRRERAHAGDERRANGDYDHVPDVRRSRRAAAPAGAPARLPGSRSPRARPAPPATTATNAAPLPTPFQPEGSPSPKSATPATIGTAFVKSDASPAVASTPPRWKPSWSATKASP